MRDGRDDHRRDLAPEHFHRFLESRSGELGSLAAFGDRFICPRDRAQYESPLEVPGRTRGPPLFALPACPYDTLRVRPVFGFLTSLTRALPFAGFAITNAFF